MIGVAIVSFDRWFDRKYEKSDAVVAVDQHFQLTELLMPGGKAVQSKQFSLHNETDVLKRLVLHARFRHIEYLSVSLIHQGKETVVLQADASTTLFDKPEQHRWLKRTIELKPRQQMIMQIDALDSVYGYTPMYLFEEQAYYFYDWFSLANSALLIAILGFFTFTATLFGFLMRSRLFLGFALVQGGFFVYELYIQNYLHVLFWPEAPEFNLVLSGYLGLLTASSVLLFARSLFNTELKNTRHLEAANVLLIIIAVGAIAVFVDYGSFSRTLVYVIAGGSNLLAMSLALRAYFRGAEYAKYYLIGWSFLMATFISFTVASTGNHGMNMVLSNIIVEWGLLLDGSCFTIALVLKLLSEARSRSLIQDAYAESLRSNFKIAAARDAAQQKAIESSRLLAEQAHDIRQPLYAIKLHANNIADVKTRDAITQAVESLDRFAASSLDTQKTFSDVQPQREVFAEVIEEMIARYQPLAMGQGIRMQFRQDIHAMLRVADRNALDRLLSNVMINACQHGSRGTVDIHLRKENGVVLRVTNPSYKTSTEPFVKAAQGQWAIENTPTPEAMGTGLGLMTMYRLADSLGVELDFDIEDSYVSVSLRFSPSMAATISESEPAAVVH